MTRPRARSSFGLGILGFALLLTAAGCAETEIGECVLAGEEFISETTRGDCNDLGGQFIPLGDRSLVSPI